MALTVERLDDGEVSPYLVGELRRGDGLEMRGPIGGYFVWDVAVGGPLLLVAGGSGIVPLMAMLRRHARADASARAAVPVRLLYSARTPDDVIYHAELEQLADPPLVEVVFTFTRNAPPTWTGYRRRIDRAMLESVSWPPSAAPARICVRPDGARRVGSDATRGARARGVARADGAVRPDGMRRACELVICRAESRGPGGMPCRPRRCGSTETRRAESCATCSRTR